MLSLMRVMSHEPTKGGLIVCYFYSDISIVMWLKIKLRTDVVAMTSTQVWLKVLWLDQDVVLEPPHNL